MTLPAGKPGRLAQRAVLGVGITVDAVSDRSFDPAMRRAIHEELIEDLAVHGRLVFTSQAHLDRFREAVGQLPTSLAKAWEAVLSSRRLTVAIAQPPVAETLGDILDPVLLDQELVDDDVELVLVQSAQAELLGVAEDEYSALTPSGLIEIGRMTTAGRTISLQAARRILEDPLREGVNREDEWNGRFGPLCADAKPLVIYDKFVGQQTARRYVYSQGATDGLTWFLARFAMKPGRRVRVITAVTDRPEGGRSFDVEAVELGFRRMLAPFGSRDLHVELVLVPDRAPGDRGRGVERFGHDRHIRFGERAALALGAGMQAFANVNFRETITVAKLPVADAKAREERAVKAALRPPQGGWLAGL